MVETVDRVDGVGGSANVIAAWVHMSGDMTALCGTCEPRPSAPGCACGVCVEWEAMHEVAAVHMDRWVWQAVRGAVGGDAVTSRAGHDAQVMAQVMEVGRAFVRSRSCVSHHVDEHVADKDALEGAEKLLEVVMRIAGCIAPRRRSGSAREARTQPTFPQLLNVVIVCLSVCVCVPVRARLAIGACGRCGDKWRPCHGRGRAAGQAAGATGTRV